MTASLPTHSGPDFFVIGAQRAGTTRLCGLLDGHPDLAIPTKEPMFFQSSDAMRAKSDWYRSLFDPVPEAPLKGDGSTYYSMCGIYPGTAQRIHEWRPDAKIIYLVRHPLRRIESAWVHLLAVGDANRVRGFDFTLRRTDLLTDPSLYWRQLSEYLRYFPDEQIQVHFFEDFIVNEAAVVESCCAFLGVGPPPAIERTDDRFRNESAGKRQRAWIVDAVRALPKYEAVKGRIPQWPKTLFDRHFTSPISPGVTWRRDTLAWTIARLQEDTSVFLTHMGRAADYWMWE